MSDFLQDQTSGELAGWLAFLRVDDEAAAQRTAIAILKAFRSGNQQPAKQAVDDDEDGPPIDTTKPEFAEKFKGFVGKPGQSQSQMRPMRSTEILKG